MSTVYPNGIDNAVTLPVVFDNITQVTADTVNRIRDTIISIEQTLGIAPQGTYTITGGVRARLDNVDASIVSLNTSVTNVVNTVTTIISNLDGEEIKLGTPVGGFLTGITSLQDATPITEAINTFNNIMSFLAPAQPQSVNGLAIDAVTSITIVQGANIKVADVTGHAIGYFKTGFPAGSGNYRITKTQAFTLTTHNTGDATTGFSDGDKGIVAVLVNGVQVTTFNLGTAFDDAYRSALAGQGVSYAGNTGSASAPLKVVDSHTQIYSVGLFNGFPLWQKGVVRITNTTLTPGYNTFQIVHTVGSSTRTSQLFELFYDSGAVNPSFNSATLGINSAGSFNFLSGIKYLTTGDTLIVHTEVANAFVNTYLQAPLTCSFTTGIPSNIVDLSDPLIFISGSGTASAPNSGDIMVLGTGIGAGGKVYSISVANQQTVNQLVTLTYTNAYGATFTTQAAGSAGAMLINTYNSAASTATTESFVDENRRLLPDISGSTNTSAPYPNDYVTIPGTLTGQWTSTAGLVNGNAQYYNAQLVYPTGNFTTGFSPTQGGSTNYSGFNNTNSYGGQVYYRAMFSAGNPRSTGTLTINGVSLLDLTQISPNVKVELKLPGALGTGWLDLSKPFSGTFSGITGDGCRSGNSGSVFGWSVGTFTTGNSGFMYILRITLYNTTKPISSLVESFTQTF